MTFTGNVPEALPHYWQDLYGKATITWVPPVTSYNYPENLGIRTALNRDFRWGEVTIDLDDVQEDAVLDFTMPDSYMIQITPDLGWGNVLAMFGEDEELNLNNPHIKSFGPFIMSAGTLTDNGDDTVTATLSEDEIRSVTIAGANKYLWRAVPWADNNAGLGGLPETFQFISNQNDLNFSVDEIIKETRRPIQTVSGTKSVRATISVENENNPTVFVEQTEAVWRVFYTIDRPLVQFRIKAADDSGTIVGFHQVSIEYDTFNQTDGHVWNTFDSFALAASLERLPEEHNQSLRERTIDAFSNRGGSDYFRLITALNRELGLERVRDGLILGRALNPMGEPVESSIDIEAGHTRIGVRADSFIINDEIKKVDPYFHTIFTDKRIDRINNIFTDKGVEIPKAEYEVIDEPEGNEIKFTNAVSGILRVSYGYVEDIKYNEHPLLGDVFVALSRVINPSGIGVVTVEMNSRLSGSEPASALYKISGFITTDFPILEIGWGRAAISSVSNREWKRSFRDSETLYFNSVYYRYVLELKSQTNIEWGFVVADKDFWDPLDSDHYGRQALEFAHDIRLSNYSLPVRAPEDEYGRSSFDPWEAFRMGYYFDRLLIKNTAFPKIVFKSGVGFEKDCVVSVKIINLSAPKDKINQNPIVELPANVLDIDEDAVSNTLISF